MVTVEVQQFCQHLGIVFPEQGRTSRITQSEVTELQRHAGHCDVAKNRVWHRDDELSGNVVLVIERGLPSLVEHFEAFFATKPSFRNIEKYDFVPNNTVQLIDYEPDADMWGGLVGLPIAERHFQSSSEVILDFMNRKGDNWSSDDVLATAIQMHLGFAESADMDIEESIRFFEYCLLYHSTEDFRLQYLEEFFDNQREPFINFHTELWDALQTKGEFKEDIYNQWIEQCFYSTADLVRTFRLRALKVEAKFSALWTLYARLLRMTNNRLGIQGRDESLIFYLMMRSLEKIGIENMKI